MMMRILCAIVLLAFGAISIVRAQDIEVQPIENESSTETSTTSTESTDESALPSEEVEDTTTELITTMETTSSDEELSTVEDEDTTTTITTTSTEAEDTTTASTPVEVTTIKTRKTPLGDGLTEVCQILLRNGRRHFNWIYGGFMYPKVCSYCCMLYCKGVPYSPMQCINIFAFHCRH